MSDIKEKIDDKTKSLSSLCEIMESAIKSEFDKGFEQIDTHEMYEAVDILKDLSEAKLNAVKMCYYTQIMEAMEKSEYGEDYDKNGEIRYYRGQPRSTSSGRFMSMNDGRRGYEERYPIEWNKPEIHYYMPDISYYRDMDMGRGRMYYPESTGVSTSTGSGMPRQNPNEVANDRGMDSNEGNNRFYGGNRGYSDNRGYQESNYERNRRQYTEMKQNGNNSVESNKMKMDKLNEVGDNLDESIKTMLRGSSEQEKTAVKNRLMQIAQGIK